MKPSITRWNTVPLKYGCVTLRPDRGSVHSFDPSASPVKFATFALARSGVIEPTRECFVFGLGVGPVTVALTWKGDDLGFAWMSQAKPIFGEPIADKAAAAAALSLSPAAVAGTGHPVQEVSCGVPFLFVPIATRSAVDNASVNAGVLDAFMRSSKAAAHGVFLFSAQPGSDHATVYSRLFAPDIGISDEPATGT